LAIAPGMARTREFDTDTVVRQAAAGYFASLS
jgi:hypothetical protein